MIAKAIATNPKGRKLIFFTLLPDPASQAGVSEESHSTKIRKD